MALHDAYARLTPFEIAFPELEAIGALSSEAAEEARARGLDDADPEAFMRLEAAGRALRALGGDEAPADTFVPLAALVFHCVHFHRAGHPLFLLETAAARRLVAAAPPGEPTPPAPAGYLQLPQHLVWTGEQRGGPPESVDGIFWTEATHGMLHALVVTGIRPGRPGFGAVPVPAAPLADASSWLDAVTRGGGGDFRTSLPGADLDALVGVESAGEVLKLLARFFALSRGRPQRLERSLGASREGGGPVPSALPYARVASPP